MKFSDFTALISKIQVAPLEGSVAHDKMCPPERNEMLQKQGQNVWNEAKTAAVLSLIYPKDEEAHLVLIVRNTYKGVHSAQIAFPGGKVETTDKSLAHTALRETFEEIGIVANDINIIKPLSQLYIPPSRFWVHPFLGVANRSLSFVPDANEVAQIIEWPLKHILDETKIGKKLMQTSYMQAVEVPGFLIDEHFVWGATAMILSELKECLKSVL
ncbi:CoA pyrophosphatase [Flavobacterium branchiophilum]|uniref:Probable pyrophosphohydrolase n=1 Tax=Flavobacterium branchiophilum (strain FL-15) TaxID=1034807 RepID=G2Z2V6_FLABF|nr:CoA pyrophosphatase [Flavobacterium branchiophilum]CCB70285.1 Probable pyrophosphohydrolase [Flavobacterium branchiophilum FL-15]